MNDIDAILFGYGSSWCHFLSASKSEMTALEYEVINAGFTARHLRGTKMRNYAALFDEFSSALQFPWYFGENGNAFAECISDLSWLSPGNGYVFLISDCENVLSLAEDDGLSWLVRSLGHANLEWSKPVTGVEQLERTPVPFHFIVQADERMSETARSVWRAAGAELTEFPN
jgi:hypothetical protein